MFKLFSALVVSSTCFSACYVFFKEGEPVIGLIMFGLGIAVAKASS